MKRLGLLIVTLILALPLHAQIPSGFVQTTATVLSLANGQYSAAWTNLSGSPQLPLLGGTSAFPQSVNGRLDSNGHMSVLLADTSQIIPTPSTWTFSFIYSCPTNPSPGGFQVAVAVVGGGATEDISTQIADALPSNPCGGGGGGGGGSPAAPAYAIQQANAGVNGFTAGPVYQLPGGSQTPGFLQAFLTSAAANSKIILPATYAETLPASLVFSNPNVTLECSPGATLTKGGNFDLATIGSTGTKITGCTLNGQGATALTISSISCNGTTCTVTTATTPPASFVTGSFLAFGGTGITGIDVHSFTAATVSGSTITFASSVTGTASAGTVTGGYSGNGITITGATPDLENNTVTAAAGYGIYLNGTSSAITGALVKGNTVTGSQGDPIYGAGNISDSHIEGNTVDSSSFVVFGHSIALHATGAQQLISNVTIDHNVIRNGYAYCVEVGAFGGLFPTNITINNNVCKQISNVAGHSFGGYSLASVSGVTVSGNAYYNLLVNTNLLGIEVVNANRVTATGNVIWGDKVSFNQATRSTLVGNHIFPLFPQTDTAVYIGGSNAGMNSDYNTFADNTIDRSGMTTANPAWAASTFYGPGSSIIDANGNLEVVVNIVGNTACESGSSAPTWPTPTTLTTPTYTADNQCQWQLSVLGAGGGAYVGGFYGIWQQCNSSTSDCSHNDYHDNKIIDNATSTYPAIKIENDGSSTTSDILIHDNMILGYTGASGACYSISPSVTSAFVYNNTEKCTSIGTLSSASYLPLGGPNQRNMVDDTDFAQGCGAWWTCGANSSPLAYGGPKQDGSLAYTGGTQTGALYTRSASPITVIAATTYAFSAYVNATNVTAGSVYARVCADPTCATPLLTLTQTNGTASTLSATFNTLTYTTAYVVLQVSNITVSSGNVLWAEPCLQPGSGACYYTANDGAGIGRANGGGNFHSLAVQGNPVCQQNGTNCGAANFTLTTTGTSGPATYTSGTLNIPQYSGGSGFTPGGDLSGSSTSQEVIGLLSHALPSLTAGYLQWNGSAWVFSSPSGSGTVSSGGPYNFAAYGSGTSTTVGPINITTDSTGNDLLVPGYLAIGTSPGTCGTSVTGCIALTESGTAGTPSSGTDYIRASTSHLFECSINGGSEYVCPDSYQLGNSGNDIPQLSSGLLSSSIIPTLNQNTTGTAANLSGTPALPNGTTATTQASGDATTKLATDAFVAAINPLSLPTIINTSAATPTAATSYYIGIGGSLQSSLTTSVVTANVPGSCTLYAVSYGIIVNTTVDTTANDFAFELYNGSTALTDTANSTLTAQHHGQSVLVNSGITDALTSSSALACKITTPASYGTQPTSVSFTCNAYCK